MAKRCLELERYEVAAEKYVDLLGMTVDSSILQCEDIPNSMPDFIIIYCEAVAALLMVYRHEDVCLVAQELISKSTSSDDNGRLLIINQFSSPSLLVSFSDETLNVSKNTLLDETFDEPMESTSRKRLRSDDKEMHRSCQSSDEEKLLHVAIVLMMQAESLVEMNQSSDALECLDHVCQLLGDVMPIIEEQLDDGVGIKRRRINTDGELATTRTNDNKIHNRLLEIKSDAYNNKAMVLIGLNKGHEALQMLLLSIHCNADNSNAVYNHTLILFDMKRQIEAVNNWLQYRHIDSKMDSLQISHLLRKKSTFLRTQNEQTDEYQLVKMDQICLEWWMKSKHQVHTIV
uniref:Uncharacterized protein LOC102801977 n=1 Tax=Saccoglossus kowalevskii TaxID=10224 RepID=A0ABM0MBQ8_SACKO|nr:PREDICTED: uncharacterized protein LOC102801977 [Saccoglossus kowalevskii]